MRCRGTGRVEVLPGMRKLSRLRGLVMPVKQDRIIFHGKYCDYEVALDVSLPPRSGERTDKIKDIFCEWEYWNEQGMRAEKESRKKVGD